MIYTFCEELVNSFVILYYTILFIRALKPASKLLKHNEPVYRHLMSAVRSSDNDKFLNHLEDLLTICKQIAKQECNKLNLETHIESLVEVKAKGKGKKRGACVYTGG